ncbi:hypothetical protein EVA_22439 [gut metagenome]|uniref:Uncharacterized protein n=1 Tax=gut metagenome TaxID=749906 RepID=J9BPD9_9ZZZZ
MNSIAFFYPFGLTSIVTLQIFYQNLDSPLDNSSLSVL